MFFNDGLNQRKVNMGNLSLTSKDDFMKKMEVEEQKEKEQKKIDKARKVIENFFKKNFAISPKIFEESKIIANLNSVINLIKENDFPKEKKEKLAILSIKKVSEDLLNILNCRGLSNKNLFNLIHTVSEVLGFTNNESVSLLFNEDDNMKYTKIFFKLIKGSIYELYFNIQKKYLINEKSNAFAYLFYLNYVFPKDIKNLIYKSLSKNTSFIFVLTKILYKTDLMISQYSKEIFFEFCGNLSKLLTNNRKRNNKYKFNSIVYKFLEILLYSTVNNITDESNRNNKNKNYINLFDICCNLEESPLSFLENHVNNNNLLYLFE